ncbi:MAG: hypothetical protein G01um101417_633 [Parcubacteria group bacterium Gr01-1014_17]|nr:MAG: hypothetical protein G01um101417_633 [Parcubacteria group bacterium Gr01-1014_17]
MRVEKRHYKVNGGKWSFVLRVFLISVRKPSALVRVNRGVATRTS